MPKRVGFLYEKMCDRDAIRSAILVAARHKRHRYDVIRVIENLERYVDKTYAMLMNDNFIPSKPREKVICDHSSQKERTIEIVPFWPDGVMHQLLVTAMQPILLRGMHHWCCASIPGRGGSHAQRYVKRILRTDQRGTRYVCKMDIHHFYHSIDRTILMHMLRRKIKDERFLSVVQAAIESCKEGLAIGFYICQWLANFYLESMDRAMLAQDGVSHDVRYMDDFILFGPNKKKLHRARKAAEVFLQRNLRLRLKRNWQVFSIKRRPLDFVGYKFSPDHTTLRRRTSLRFMRQCRRACKRIRRGRPIPFQMASALISRRGLAKHCDSKYLLKKYFGNISEQKLKEVVSNESKRRNRAAKPVYA